MLQIFNETVLNAQLALLLGVDGAECVAVAAKATFRLPQGRQVTALCAEQVPVFYADEFFSEPEHSSVKYPADVVLGKRGTDIILVGTAYSPGGVPVRRLQCAVRVGHAYSVVDVIGDRGVKTKFPLRQLLPLRPRPFISMPLRYERAFGGYNEKTRLSDTPSFCPYNPIGVGFHASLWRLKNRLYPNIEYPGQHWSVFRHHPPTAGFGAIPCSWEPRKTYSGTYDRTWQETKCPLLPDDFDLRFFNTAPEALQVEGFISGAEQVELINVSTMGNYAFRLPEVHLRFAFRMNDSVIKVPGQIWTVLFEPDENRFYMVWGATYSVGKLPSRCRGVEIQVSGDFDFAMSLPQREGVKD